MSQDLKAGQSQNIKTGNSTFESSEDFKNFGMTLINQNAIQEKIKSI